MDNAKEMIAESLPIKCLEAVILSLYLTAPLTNIHRFTIGFKSNFNGLCYRHVVLGVSHNSSYGALGLSRRKDLMYKPLEFKVRMNTYRPHNWFWGPRGGTHCLNPSHRFGGGGESGPFPL